MFKCIECEYYSQRSYNVQRHMLNKHNLTIQCKDMANPNVTISNPNVTISNPNVTISNPNVINVIKYYHLNLI
jgi:hypothetical protein